MKTSLTLLGLVVISMTSSTSGYTIPKRASITSTFRSAASASTSIQMSTEQFPDPTTFREAEILGLRLMQEGNFEEALVGMFDFLFEGSKLVGGMKKKRKLQYSMDTARRSYDSRIRSSVLPCMHISAMGACRLLELRSAKTNANRCRHCLLN